MRRNQKKLATQSTDDLDKEIQEAEQLLQGTKLNKLSNSVKTDEVDKNNDTDDNGSEEEHDEQHKQSEKVINKSKEANVKTNNTIPTKVVKQVTTSKADYENKDNDHVQSIIEKRVLNGKSMENLISNVLKSQAISEKLNNMIDIQIETIVAKMIEARIKNDFK